jgi:hypothetical protein
MRIVARRLIAAEQRPKDSADSEGRAAFRVCDKLRESLSPLAGIRGFRSLLARALSLAKVEVPWLGKLEVSADGSLVVPDGLETETAPSEAARGGVALVAQLLELLATFIGEALTLRIVQQTWPKTALDGPNSRDKT